MNVLVMCTANRCRSPLAAALVARAAQRRGDDIEVRSSGTHAVDGEPAMRESIAVGDELGVDISGHLSQALTLELGLWADLVVCMESDQATDVAGRFPGSARHTFLLRELADRPMEADEEWQQWLARNADGRTMRDLMVRGRDIDDPVGRPLGRHRKMGDEVNLAIEAWLGRRSVTDRE